VGKSCRVIRGEGLVPEKKTTFRNIRDRGKTGYDLTHCGIELPGGVVEKSMAQAKGV